MKFYFLLFVVFSFVSGCTNKSSKDDSYFKITFSDEPKPANILTELIEVSSQGKLVLLSNRFNENDELYQTYHFVELNKQQIDSLYNLISNAKNVLALPDTGNDTLYKLNFEETINGKRHNQFVWVTKNDTKYLNFIKYCQKITEYSKRFDMHGSYYFNTNEVCGDKK